MSSLAEQPDRCACTDTAPCLYHYSLERHARRRRNPVDVIRSAGASRARPGRLPPRHVSYRHQDGDGSAAPT